MPELLVCLLLHLKKAVNPTQACFARETVADFLIRMFAKLDDHGRVIRRPSSLETDEFFFLLATGISFVQIILLGGDFWPLSTSLPFD